MLEYLRKELVGPKRGTEEELPDGYSPDNQYIMGVLFPQKVTINNPDSYDEEEDSIVDTGEEMEDPISLSGQYKPASMGLSFYFEGSEKIEVRVYGARYEFLSESKTWKRIPVASVNSPEILNISAVNGTQKTKPESVLQGLAEIHTRWRKFQSGFLVTVTLVNAKTCDTAYHEAENCLYQTGFHCRPEGGAIKEYPSIAILGADAEEDEIRLLYRHVKVFGVGHGCSVNWDIHAAHEKGYAGNISTEVLPFYAVPDMTHELDLGKDQGEEKEEDQHHKSILSIARLANPAITKPDTIEGLKRFVRNYEAWIGNIKDENTNIQGSLKSAETRIVDRLKAAASRMFLGIELLSNPVVWKAFQLANLAMLMQMYHGGKEVGGRKRRKEEGIVPQDINYFSLTDYRWRPFQLAYFLLTLSSVADGEDAYRETVDLIWFPTGGGKTEAYLALAAFEIFHRRLSYGEKGAGTTVITRYTLRLLTSQQFQRAARLICACELIRQKLEEELGREPITIGFWVGRANTPNEYADAKSTYEILLENPTPNGKNPFQLEQCPWCGTELVPVAHKEDPAYYGMRVSLSSFEFFCPSEQCAFNENLPIAVVDEHLYEIAPTFLIATVDKFARLAWIEKAGAFFGQGKFRPPSLVIQDELHLLSGPLGTIVGLYESAFDILMTHENMRPKVLASTATIRRAGDQVKGLFARNVNVFPPPGLNADDSYFARVKTGSEGRLYAGIMAPAHRPTTALIRIAAAMQQAPLEVVNSENNFDGYYTLVVYHNSLRELGKTVTFGHDDIPARVQIIADKEPRTWNDQDILELTSNLSAEEIPASLHRMGHPHNHAESVSMVVCTNMFSVGVDVSRLALMLVNGQPKTTSEYIQSSSRVGRGSVPGLVITHFSSSKPRDRSHYEGFLPFHAALYRYVEPSSVTPFAFPSRKRALHAALVILVRHKAGLSANKEANDFRKDRADIQKLAAALKDRVVKVDPDEANQTHQHINTLVESWHQWATDPDKLLVYRSNGRQFRALLSNFGSNQETWPTLHSMRNVDRQCEISVVAWRNQDGRK